MPQTGRGKRLLARTSRRSSLPAGEDARLQTTYRLPLTMDGSPSRPYQGSRLFTSNFDQKSC